MAMLMITNFKINLNSEVLPSTKMNIAGLCVGQPSKRLSQQVFQSLDEPVRSMGQWDQKSAKIPLGDDGRRI